MAEEKTYSQIRNEFYKNFREKCTPILQNFEKERKNAIRIAVLAFISLIIVAAIAIMFILTLENGNISFTLSDTHLFFIIFTFASPFSALFAYSMSFENKIKKTLMPILCKCFSDLKWVENAEAKHSLYKSAGIITKKYNRSYVDDVFVGSFKNVPVEIAEVKYQEVTHRRTSDGKTKTDVETIFNGVIITLAMNKNFSAHTLVKSDSLIKSAGVSGLRHTTLEDVVFEKKFDVYTNDEVEARYLLTTSFMERMTEMKTIYKAKNTTCAFYKDKFIIALDVRRDMFKLGSIFKKADDERQYFQMYEEIISIIKLIDHFKLDQKIGL